MKEVVIIMGYPASGKSTFTKKYERDGYFRLNRDDSGGSLADLNKELESKMKSGVEKFVLDNTYGTADKRKPIVDLCKKYGYSSLCVWLNTSPEDAQWNSCSRILSKIHQIGSQNGKSRFAHEMVGHDLGGVKDPAAIPAAAIFAYKKSFEKPDKSEGWDKIEKVAFVREPISGYTNGAIVFDYDDTLRKTISGDKFPCSPNDIELLPDRSRKLKELVSNGTLILGASNQSGIEKGTLSMEDALACFKKTNDLLGVNIDVQFCPHHSFPIRCYCRKPMPGMAVYMIHKYHLDPSKVTMVGDQTSDETFAFRSGFKFVHVDEYFSKGK